MASSLVYKIKNSTFLRAVSSLRGHRSNYIATVQRLQSDSLFSSLSDLKQVSDESSCSPCKKSTKIFANARRQSTPFSLPLPECQPKTSFRTVTSTILGNDLPPVSTLFSCRKPVLFQHTTVSPLLSRCITTARNLSEQASQDSSAPILEMPPRIKFKRLDKTAKHIMQILDKEDVERVKAHREIPDIKPGYIVQLKVEVPENKRRVSILKGIVIARRNAGLNTTFRLRRLVAGVGVESLFPLYSPNIKEIKVIDKKKVKRAKLYYLRDKMNALKKQ